MEGELLHVRPDSFRKLYNAAVLNKLRSDKVEFFRRATGHDPAPWQERFLTSGHKRKLLNCSRQAGKSTVNAVDCLHDALFVPGSLILVYGPAERQAKEFFGKVVECFTRLGHERDGFDAGLAADRKLGMTLPNGSRIEALPGSEKTTRGFSAPRKIVLDEAARIDDGLYHAVRPMLMASGGSLHLLSTPYGKRGVFHDAWTSGTNWDRYMVDATEVPHFSEEDLEEERASMPARVFAQEYMCMFTETDDAMFTSTEIAEAMDDALLPLAV